jgi:hypothetical protein
MEVLTPALVKGIRTIKAKVASKKEGELQVFGYGSEGNVISKVYNETEGGWTTGTMDMGKF